MIDVCTAFLGKWINEFFIFFSFFTSILFCTNHFHVKQHSKYHKYDVQIGCCINPHIDPNGSSPANPNHANIIHAAKL